LLKSITCHRNLKTYFRIGTKPIYSKARIMKYLLQTEAIVPFLLSIFLINQLPVHFSWWAWILLFLAPDISMLGYAINKRVGAWVYNLFHHQLISVIVMAIGWLCHFVSLELAGLILLGHSSLDRVMGYGLKYEDGFNHTHLGMMGKAAKP
jgi:hypothetical protein